MLYFLGCFWHTLGLIVFPTCVAAIHAALRRPPTLDDTQEMLLEIRHRLVRVLHHKLAESDEMEAGSSTADDFNVDVRDAEMVKRVEQIRQKYRCIRTARNRNLTKEVSANTNTTNYQQKLLIACIDIHVRASVQAPNQT